MKSSLFLKIEPVVAEEKVTRTRTAAKKQTQLTVRVFLVVDVRAERRTSSPWPDHYYRNLLTEMNDKRNDKRHQMDLDETVDFYSRGRRGSEESPDGPIAELDSRFPGDSAKWNIGPGVESTVSSCT